MYGEISSLLKLSSLPWETETACTVGSCSKRGAGRCGGGLRGEKPSPRGETIPRCSHRSSHLSHAGAPDSCRSADDLQLVSVGVRLGLALGWIGCRLVGRHWSVTASPRSASVRKLWPACVALSSQKTRARHQWRDVLIALATCAVTSSVPVRVAVAVRTAVGCCVADAPKAALHRAERRWLGLARARAAAGAVAAKTPLGPDVTTSRPAA